MKENDESHILDNESRKAIEDWNSYIKNHNIRSGILSILISLLAIGTMLGAIFLSSFFVNITFGN